MQKLELYRINGDDIPVPLIPAKIKAGGYGSFESPALDFPEDTIDLLKHIIRDKDTTFLGRVTGDSLKDIGIFDNDILVIEKGTIPKTGDKAVVFLDGEFFIKVFQPKYKPNSLQLSEIILKSENPAYNNITITEFDEFQIWGIATFNIHKLN